MIAATGYHRRKAALWLASAASFRQAAQRGGDRFGYRACIIMAREAVAAAADNRRGVA